MKSRKQKSLVGIMILTLLLNGLLGMPANQVFAFTEAEVAEGFLRIHF